MDYVRRELSDFMEAGIGYEGNYPNGFTPWQAWMSYNHMLCLTEAAYQLYINQQMQSVTNAFSKHTVELEEVGQSTNPFDPLDPREADSILLENVTRIKRRPRFTGGSLFNH